MACLRIAIAALLLALPLTAHAAETGDVLLAWQIETVEPEDGPGVQGFGSGADAGARAGGVEFGIEPVRPGGRGPLFEGGSQRPSVFGEGRDPLYRPGPGRNCTGEGPGRVCF
jgi:hypothetical protein